MNTASIPNTRAMMVPATIGSRLMGFFGGLAADHDNNHHKPSILLTSQPCQSVSQSQDPIHKTLRSQGVADYLIFLTTFYMT
jgi:hypothetical protein